MDRLPPELISQIVTLLPRSDILVVRQTSKYIESSSFDHFAHLFFRKRGFMITTESLNVLTSISRHHGLCKHVQHLWFNPDCFTFVNNPFWTLDSDDEEPTPRYEDQMRRARLFDEYVHDHWDLLYSSRLQEILAEVFKSLPMLRTVGMRRGTYKPYGWQTVSNNVGLDPRILGGEVSLYTTAFADPTYLFIAIIKALATSRKRIRRLYTDAIQIDHVDQRLMLSESDCRHALDSVQYVEINATGLPEARDVTDPSALRGTGKHASNLETLLGSMHELLEIGMTIFRDPKQRHMIPPEPRRLQSYVTPAKMTFH
ncbi:hypothetical protein AMS68_004966 [Peltaster fructicola]|uniref:F-box domain-containing protein n=1 Tax=Peltaster fructicola TaxID=286661 RepID=A0A6H0XXV1_9PEZI|nr:hypothetical protein AMS68_004966 [Peltaster fructicola]